MLQRSSQQHFALFVVGTVLAALTSSLLQGAQGVRSVAEKEKKFLKESSSRLRLRSPHLAQAYEDYLQRTTGSESASHLRRTSFAQETSRTRRVRSSQSRAAAKEVPGYPGSLDPEKVEEAKIARSEYQDDWSREWKLGPPRKVKLAEDEDESLHDQEEEEVLKSGWARAGRLASPPGTGLGLLLLLTAAAAWGAN